MIATLPGIPASVGESRALAAAAIGAGHPAAEATVLCVSELVTNAIVHTRSGLPGGRVRLNVAAIDSLVFVEVTDAGGDTRPVAGDPEDATEHGRGLLIIAALAKEWGTSPALSGRATWCWIEGSES